jgi:prefoldin alpha subunit
MDDKEKKMFQFQMLQQNAEEIKKRMQIILKTFEEIELTKKALSDLNNLKKSQALIPIGAGSFVKGHIDDVDKILVDVGGGIIIEKTSTEALKITEDREEQVKQALSNLSMQEQMIQAEIIKLQPEIQKLLGG